MTGRSVLAQLAPLRCALRNAAATLALLGGAALAGTVEGPFIVWINLGTAQPQRADAQITAFVNGPQRLCWPDGALLYMREHPPGVTPALVRRALVQRNVAAQKALRALLRQPFGEVPGFDGVVAYADHGKPRLLALPMVGAVRAEAVRSASGEDAWGATFCRVLPPISRRP